MLARAVSIPFAALAASAVLAQEPSAAPATPPAPEASAAAPAAEASASPETSAAPAAAASAPAIAPGTLVTVPALTPVYLRIDDELTSKKNKPGDHFPIHIDEDVRVGDVVVIPAGSTGEGEVIHAARSSIGGKAGEILIAA